MTRGIADSAARPAYFLPRAAIAGFVLSTLAAALVGCTSEPTDVTSPTPSADASTPAAEPEPAPAPALHPEGSAEDNEPLFSAVIDEVWASAERDAGRAYIDALTAAGFDRERMQLTADRSTVGNPAESIQFSVAWRDGQCLIGQTGPSTGEPVTAVMPQLAEGRCLIGDTRPIDW
ncbi:DUF6993 domain-containing protein [Microbacterium sp. NPDC058345]|uniref:DUF6993 domain-containing protein n=1 Tax=Microbacterium sp. NPDC058345 TaxID=3346455 RepID=UPI003661A3EF